MKEKREYIEGFRIFMLFARPCVCKDLERENRRSDVI